MATHPDYPHLLAPLSHTALSAAHRVVIAPMTRFRADDYGVLLRGVARYCQRAGAALGNTGFGHTTTAEVGEALVRDGLADLVSFGRRYIANQDLPERLRDGSPLADYDERTLYTQTDAGYIDYPRASAVDSRSAGVVMSA
jgi:N-ethylmaleimide reductase